MNMENNKYITVSQLNKYLKYNDYDVIESYFKKLSK